MMKYLITLAAIIAFSGCQKDNTSGAAMISAGELSDAERVELHLPAKSDLTLAKDPDIQAARTIDVAVQRTVAEFLKPTGREFKITAARQVGKYILLWISFPKIDDGGVDLIFSVEKKRIVGEFFGGYRG